MSVSTVKHLLDGYENRITILENNSGVDYSSDITNLENRISNLESNPYDLLKCVTYTFPTTQPIQNGGNMIEAGYKVASIEIYFEDIILNKWIPLKSGELYNLNGYNFTFTYNINLDDSFVNWSVTNNGINSNFRYSIIISK